MAQIIYHLLRFRRLYNESVFAHLEQSNLQKTELGSVAKLKPKRLRALATDVSSSDCDSEETCYEGSLPKMSSFGNHRTCPLRIMFTISIP
jgi:hypothetical protein